MDIDNKMTAARWNLHLLQRGDEDDEDQEGEVEHEHPELLKTRTTQVANGEDPVIFHYKAEMDDPLFLPLYPEGVQYWLMTPETEPEICPHLRAWKHGKIIEGTAVKEVPAVEAAIEGSDDEGEEGRIAEQKEEEAGPKKKRKEEETNCS